jgi:hypothetical protein
MNHHKIDEHNNIDSIWFRVIEVAYPKILGTFIRISLY